MYTTGTGPTRKVLGALALTVAVSVLAGWQITRPLELQPDSRLWVEGTSSTKDWRCAAGDFTASIGGADAGAVNAVLGGQKAVTTVELTVPIAKLDCNNGTMNEHMRKALKASEHPVILFRLASYELTRGDSGMQAALTGTLTLGGQERPVTIDALVTGDDAGVLHVTGRYPIHMKEYGLKPPTLMLGMMKVGELVTVGFDLRLKD